MSTGVGVISYPDNVSGFQKYAQWGSAENSPDLSSWFTATKHAAAVISGALGSSPFNGVDAYDPETDLTEIETEFNLVKSELDVINPVDDWQEFLNTVDGQKATIFPEDDIDADIHTSGIVSNSLSSAQTVAAAILSDAKDDTDEEFDLAIAQAGNAAGISCVQAAIDALSATQSQLIEDAVNEYKDETIDDHLESVNRFTGPMADINAVMGSAFVIGLSSLEGKRASDVRKFEAGLKLQAYNLGLDVYVRLYSVQLNAHTDVFKTLNGQQLNLMQTIFQSHVQAHISSRLQTYSHKAAFVNNAVSEMIRILMSKSGLALSKASLRGEIGKLKIGMYSAEIDKNLVIDARDAMWDLDIHRAGAVTLFGASGAAGYIPPKDVSSIVGDVLGTVAFVAGAATGNVPLMATGAKTVAD